MTKKLVQKLKSSLNEKDVENSYREEVLSFFKDAKITSPYGTDGLLHYLNENAKTLKMLLEFKYGEQLKGNIQRCGVLVQCLFYIKKFEVAGEKLPNIIFVGDENECFALHTNSVIKYLSADIDWTLAPSQAALKNPEVIMAMVKDQDITPFIFQVDENFDFSQAVEKINDLNESVVRLIRVTPHNINAIFDYFMLNVVDGKVLNPNEYANLFVQLLINPQENFIHPTKKNTLVTKNMGEVRVNDKLFKSFFMHFEHTYSPKEKENLTSIVDRLVEDTTRRRNGEFFSPTPFVDLAHKYISETFGEDWKEKYVVWDPAWGTGNLTRDYKFKELYCSTLIQSDIDTANQIGYNMEAAKFQYDFLNDDDEKLPEGLRKAIAEGREILILMNPPYATANNMGTEEGDHKGGVAKTKIGETMKKDGWGKSTQQLYAQFLYRIYNFNKNNKNIKIAIFSPPLFFSGGSFNKFREKFFEQFSFEKGFLFQASHFANVAAQWGISFSLLNIGKNKERFIFDLVDIDNDFSIKNSGTKEVYNIDDKKSASDWVRMEVKGLKTNNDVPQLTSAIKYKTEGTTMRGTVIDGKSFGYLQSAGTSVYKNTTDVSMFSFAMSQGNGLSVIKENFNKITNLFAARKSIAPTWINCKDEYLAPNEQHPDYEKFSNDSIIYSLFNNSSQQSSLRQIKYKDKLWDIKNEFFWMSKDRIKELANEFGFDELYNDARTSDERFVYKQLFKEGIYEKLSPDAKQVLDKATELLEKSFVQRQLMHQEDGKLHLNAWDAGYAQMKLVWQKYFKEEFKEFRQIYGKFEERMRPMVFELGFLKSEKNSVKLTGSNIKKLLKILENKNKTKPEQEQPDSKKMSKREEALKIN